MHINLEALNDSKIVKTVGGLLFSAGVGALAGHVFTPLSPHQGAAGAVASFLLNTVIEIARRRFYGKDLPLAEWKRGAVLLFSALVPFAILRMLNDGISPFALVAFGVSSLVSKFFAYTSANPELPLTFLDTNEIVTLHIGDKEQKKTFFISQATYQSILKRWKGQLPKCTEKIHIPCQKETFTLYSILLPCLERDCPGVKEALQKRGWGWGWGNFHFSDALASDISGFIQTVYKQPQPIVKPEIISSPLPLQEEDLSKGIDIPDSTLLKIQICMKKILDRQQEYGIKFYQSQESHRVFSLTEAPGLIFKMDLMDTPELFGLDKTYDPMVERYKKMTEAQKVIRSHKLDLLVIPRAKILKIQAYGKSYTVLAEQKLPIIADESAQEEYFNSYPEKLIKAVIQLAELACLINYSNAEKRNNPPMKESADPEGNIKIALVDLEDTKGAARGLFSESGVLRLVGDEEQAQRILAVAKKHNVDTSQFDTAYQNRKAELEDYRQLKKWHQQKKIVKGNEPINVDVETWDFPAYPGKKEELKAIARAVIPLLNAQLSASSPEASIKKRRSLFIPTNESPFSKASELIEPGESKEWTWEATLLGHVIQRLIDLEAVYKVIGCNGHGWSIQA